MSYNSEELTVFAAVLTTILIIALFFGIFWSVLLVFTFLFLLYKFGRPRRKKLPKSTAEIDTVDSSENEVVDKTVFVGAEMDVPFTGLLSPRSPSLRSPMPLLSTVTKRLSFNTSSFSPRDNNRTVYRRSFGSPSPAISQQSPRHFSLINPKFQQQQQPTIKIAPPPVERLIALQEEARDSASDPLARSTILLALKQSTARKRTAYEEDDDTDYITQQSENTKKKRRYNYPSTSESPFAERTATILEVTQDVIVNPNETIKDPSATQSQTRQDVVENVRPDLDNEITMNPPDINRMPGIGGLIQARLKRRPLHGRDDCDDVKEALSKKTRAESDLFQRNEYGSLQTSQQVKTKEQEKTKIDSDNNNTTKRTLTNKSDGDSDSGCDADDDDDVVMKSIPLHSVKPSNKRPIQETDSSINSTHTDTPNRTPTGIRKISKTSDDTPDRSRSTASTRTPTGDGGVSGGTPGRGRLSKKQMMAMKVSHSLEVTRSPARCSDSSDSTVSNGKSNTPKKRFSVVRFPSKNSEAKRRPVPVYCASVDSPDLHKRQPSSSHKITKQDIEQDRKFAWKRIQSFLDASDEEEDENKSTNSEGTTSPSIAINVVTCLATSPPRSTSITSSTTTKGVLSLLSKPSSSSNTQTTSLLSTSSATQATSSSTLPSTNQQPNPPPTYSESLLNTNTSSASTTSIPLKINLTSTKSDNNSTSTNTTGITFGTPHKSTPITSSVNSTLINSALSSQVLQTPSSSSSSQSNLGFISTGATLASTALVSTTNTQGLSQLGGGNPLLTGSNPLTAGASQAGLNPLTAGQTQAGTNPLAGGQTQAGTIPLTAGQTQAGSTGTATMWSSPIAARSIKTTQLQGSSTTFGSSSKTSELPGVDNASGTSLFAGLSKNTASPSPVLTTNGGSTQSTSGFTFGIIPTNQAKQTTENATTFAPTTSIFGSSTGFSNNTLPSIQSAAKTATTPITGSQVGLAAGAFGQVTHVQKSTTQTPGFSFMNPASQQPSTSTPSQSLFGAAKAGGSTITQSSFGASSTQSPFGAGTAQTSFGAGSTQNTFGASTPNAFGAKPTQNAPRASTTQKTFGAPSTQNAFGKANTQSAFGTSTTQNTFSAATTQNAFGATTTQNAFGASTTKNAFGASTTQSTFGGSAPQKTFGAPSSNTAPNIFGGAGGNPLTQSSFGPATKPAFGSGITQNAFGKPTSISGGFSSPATQTPFGSQAPAQSSGGFNFASKPSAPPSTSSAGGFNFAGGASTPGSSSMGGGFNFGGGSSNSAGGFAFSGTGSNSTSGTGNTAGGGFNFAPGSSQSAAGGFNFANSSNTQPASNSAGGFNFGASSSTKPAFGNSPAPGGFQFGGVQQNTQNTTPSFSSPAPSGGFNFSAGSAAPTFGGAPSTPGGFAFGASAQTPSSSVAKARPKATARRRTRK